jgi:hypothetical protein
LRGGFAFPASLRGTNEFHERGDGATSATRRCRGDFSLFGGDWSSSANEDNPNNAWNVNLGNGNVNNDNKDNDNFVWPVRGGPWRPRRP